MARARKPDGQVIDRQTKEVIGDFVAVHMRRPSNGFGKEWVAVGKEGAVEVARRGREIGFEGLVVLWWLLGHCDYDNLIEVNQAEIARDLGMRGPNVARALARLVGSDLVAAGPRIGMHRSYRLNPEMAWRGKAVGHHAALRARMKAANIRVVNG